MASDASDGSDELIQREETALTAIVNQAKYDATELLTAIMEEDIDTLTSKLNMLPIAERNNFINGSVQCHDHLHTSYTPLQLACCMGNRRICHLLIARGADVTVVNSHGKNVIHTLIDIAKYRPKMAIDMYNYVMKLCSFSDKKVLLDTRYEKCPPHLYAVKNGNMAMADAIIQTDGIFRHVLNRFGTYNVIRYDICIKGAKPHECPIRAMLQLGMDQVKIPENKAIILRPPWATWLSRSWREYSWIAFLWFLIRFGHLVILTICCIFRPMSLPKAMPAPTNHSSFTNAEYSSYAHIYAVFSDLLLFNAVVAILSNVLRLLRPSFMKVTMNKIITSVRSLCRTVRRIKKPRDTHLAQGKLFWSLSVMMHGSYIFSYLSYAASDMKTDDVALSLSVVMCYLSMLFFCTLIPKLGHFSIVMEQTIKDIFNFALFYLFILLGFSAAFFTLFQMENVEEFKSYHRTVFAVFHMTFDVVDMGTLKKANTPFAAVICFSIYVIIVVVALMNFLIAILSQTVADITEVMDVVFCLNRASLAFFLQEYPFMRCLRRGILRMVHCRRTHYEPSDGLCSVTIVEHVSENGGDIS